MEISLLFINKKNIKSKKEVSDILDKDISSKNPLYIPNKIHAIFKRELTLNSINYELIFSDSNEVLIFKTFKLMFDNKFYWLTIPLNKENQKEENFKTIEKVIKILKTSNYSIFDIDKYKIYSHNYNIVKKIRKAIKYRHINRIIKFIFEYGKVSLLITFFIFIGIYSKMPQVLIPISFIIILTYVVKDIQKEIYDDKKRLKWYLLIFLFHIFTATTYLILKYFKSKHYQSIKNKLKERKERKLIKKLRDKITEQQILSEITRDSFWRIIEYSKNKFPDNKGYQINFLIDILSELDNEKLLTFRAIREYYYSKSYTSDLWAVAYILNAGCSDDDFDWYRNWLISEGKQKYNDLLDNPENIAEKYNHSVEINGWTEDFSIIEMLAFEKKYPANEGTNYDFDEMYYEYDMPKLIFNWKDENDLKKLFPKFYKKFNVFENKKHAT